MKDIKQLIGLRIYQLRKKLNITQSNLAEKANISDDSISRIERGERTPSIQSLSSIANALGVEIKEIFNFSDVIFKEKIKNEELIDFYIYMSNKTPKEINKIFQIVKIIFSE